ncbi:MAG: hypothetical protein QF393_17250, partial [Rhodospirillales bacterium]|nr:hypothetical protein [Rhodospirillales bacterium]
SGQTILAHQVRRNGCKYLSKSFHLKVDAEKWARKAEIAVDLRAKEIASVTWANLPFLPSFTNSRHGKSCPHCDTSVTDQNIYAFLEDNVRHNQLK